MCAHVAVAMVVAQTQGAPRAIRGHTSACALPSKGTVYDWLGSRQPTHLTNQPPDHPSNQSRRVCVSTHARSVWWLQLPHCLTRVVAGAVKNGVYVSAPNSASSITMLSVLRTTSFWNVGMRGAALAQAYKHRRCSGVRGGTGRRCACAECQCDAKPLGYLAIRV